MPSLPDLDFVVDELLSEGHRDAGGDPDRIRSLSEALLCHVKADTSLDAYLNRLIAARDEMGSAAWSGVAGALSELALRRDDAALVGRLGQDVELRSVLLRRAAPERHRLGEAVIDLFHAWTEDTELPVAAGICLCVGRLARAGHDVQRFVPWLFASLAAKGEGRGSARIDVGHQAAVALGYLLAATGDAALRRELEERCSAKKSGAGKTVSKNATTALRIAARDG